jgi:signal transduction histidine kinase
MSVRFDGPKRVSCAGLRVASVNVAAKITGLMAAIVAGADSISGIGLLRRGGMGRLFEQVRAPSTLGTVLRGFTFGQVRQLDGVAAEQLAELFAAASSCDTGQAAASRAVEWAAEALDADVAAILAGGEVVASVGDPSDSATAADLDAISRGVRRELVVPGAGRCAATAVALPYRLQAWFVVARSGDGLSSAELRLLQGMARMTSMTMSMLGRLDEERSLREQSERHAAEATRVAQALTGRQTKLEWLVDEEAALRRPATLVARGVPPAEVFAAVTQEVGRVLGADATLIVHLDPDGAATVAASTGAYADAMPVGSRWTIEPPLPMAVVLRTGRPARLDDHDRAPGAYGDAVRRAGVRSGVATPIVVEGRLWGGIGVGTRRERFPADTEQRMADFTELIGAAIANAESRAELRVLAEEQAALRRVATLVARGLPPAEVFAAVAEEVGHVLATDGTVIVRLDPDGAATLVAGTGAYADQLPVGSRWSLEPPLALAVALRTGHPARLDDTSQAPGAYGDTVRRLGIRSAVAAPIVVEGRMWGAIAVGRRRGRFPADTEQRMADFTELVGTAIANADSGAQLTASRARIVAAADDARRRIERDLHDGTQQRLFALGLELRLAQSTEPAEAPGLQTQIARVAHELNEVIEELREISRGIHPAILSEGGLGPALRTLGRRAAIPVELDIRSETRSAPPIEVAAYYVVSEALTNTAKHARASYAHVAVEERDTLLCLSIRDDGIGGADPARGSGLIGLRDRVQALGGSIEVSSRLGEGTAIVVELPLQPD